MMKPARAAASSSVVPGRANTVRPDGSKMEYVQATQKDIDTALELGREAFARNVDDVAPMGRTLLSEVIGLTKEKYDGIKEYDPKKEVLLSEVPFTRKELRERIGWSETQVRRNLDQLVELGYIGRLAGRQGSTFRYVLLDTGADDPTIELRMSELEKEGWNACTEPGRSEEGKNKKSTSYDLLLATSPKLRHDFAKA